MEEKKRTKVIRPMSSIDFKEILDKWNDSFNSGISNPTDRWELAAYPVMPGKQTTQVALIFTQKIRIDEGDCHVLNKYRVLLYDMTVTPVLLNSSEFQFKDWELFSAWFFEGELYAAMRDDDERCDIIEIKGDGNERVMSPGRFVTRVCVNSKGDILAGYDCCADDDDDRQPLILYRRKGENKTLSCDDAITCDAISIDSHDGIWAYVRPYNHIDHMDGDKHENFYITLTGFSGMGVSDDGNMLLASFRYRYYGARLYAFKRMEKDCFGEEVEVILDTGDDNNDKCLISASFSGNKAVLRKGTALYMYNINELSLDEASTEEVPEKKDSKE